MSRKQLIIIIIIILWDFKTQIDHPIRAIQARRPDLVLINTEERTCQLGDFAVPVEHRMKIKNDRYLDLARELKKHLWNMNATLIPTVVGSLGTVPNGLEKRRESCRPEEEWRPSRSKDF